MSISRTFTQLMRLLYFHWMMLISSKFREAEIELVSLGIDIDYLNKQRSSTMKDINLIYANAANNAKFAISTVTSKKLDQYITELGIIDKRLNACFERRRVVYNGSKGHQVLLKDTATYFPELYFEGAKVHTIKI